MRRLLLLSLLALVPGANAVVAFADTRVALTAAPLDAAQNDGMTVTVVEVRYAYRPDGVATGPTEVVLHIAELPANVEAALVPDRVSVPVPLEPNVQMMRESPPQHGALLVRFLGPVEEPAFLTVLAHAHPNGNLKASSATLRLPLAVPAGESAPPLDVARANPAAPAAPESHTPMLVTGGLGGATLGALVVALRRR